MKHILAPVEPPFSDDIAGILASYPQRNGYLLSLFRVFANSKRFLVKGVVNLLDKASPLTMREREIVILRTCANNQCEYEWGVHVTAFGEHAGLSVQQVAATAAGEISRDADWTGRDRLLLQVVDDLCERSRISAAHYEAFQLTWDLPQQLEIIALVGNYHTISFVANTVALENEDFAAVFPK